MSLRAGILHTVPALAETFHATLKSAAPDIDLIHISDPWLLATAIDRGVTVEVEQRVARHIQYLVDSGASAVLVTCSSIGEAVEKAAAGAPVPVLRVDAPMAAQAVREATKRGVERSETGRITVLATLQATLGPTGRLIERAAGAAPAKVEVTASLVEGAIEARDAGHPEEHDRLIAAAVHSAMKSADVIVLAQASMARAIDEGALDAMVLTSPRTGADSLITALSSAEHR